MLQMMAPQEPIFSNLVVSFDGSRTPSGSVSDWINMQNRFAGGSPNRNAVQATSAKQPVSTENLKNGRNGLVFIAASLTEIVSTFGVTISSDCTMFAVYKFNSTPVNPNFSFVFDGISSGNRHGLLASGSNGITSYRTNTYPSGGITTDTADLVASGYGGASGALYKNGVLQNAGAAGTNSLTGLRIGSRWDSASYADMNLYALIYYSRLLTETERKAIEVYLGNRWGIPIS